MFLVITLEPKKRYHDRRHCQTGYHAEHFMMYVLRVYDVLVTHYGGKPDLEYLQQF